LKGKLGREFFNNNLNIKTLKEEQKAFFSFNKLTFENEKACFFFTSVVLWIIKYTKQQTSGCSGCLYVMMFLMFHRESYWEGGILPKIGQFGSTLISLYNPEVLNTVVFGVNMTHAHLRVDEVGQSTFIFLFLYSN
jgi:hypothetical protein